MFTCHWKLIRLTESCILWLPKPLMQFLPNESITNWNEELSDLGVSRQKHAVQNNRKNLVKTSFDIYMGSWWIASMRPCGPLLTKYNFWFEIAVHNTGTSKIKLTLRYRMKRIRRTWLKISWTIKWTNQIVAIKRMEAPFIK